MGGPRSHGDPAPKRSLAGRWRGWGGTTGVEARPLAALGRGTAGRAVAELAEMATEAAVVASPAAGRGPWRCLVGEALNSYAPTMFSPQCWRLGLL